MAWQGIRKHWKKYLIGGAVIGLVGRWGAKRYRDTVITRNLCTEAKKYGEDTLGMFDKPKKVYVFLNPTANNSGRHKFNKFCAPLLHLSGADVTVIESDYEGQIRTLVGYLDPATDAVVVAGGDGTLMEVMNGLLRRGDMNVPIGVIPLGKENNFFWSQNHSIKRTSTIARVIGEATMMVIRGHTQPVSVMQIKPEKGRVMYAMSGVEWGVFCNAERNRDSFKLFGKLRIYCSYLNTALRKWPQEFLMNVRLPGLAVFVEHMGRGPPRGAQLNDEAQQHIKPSEQSIVRSACQKPLDGSERGPSRPVADIRHISAASSVSSSNGSSLSHSDLTSILEERMNDWRRLRFDAVAFRINIEKSSLLKLTVWTNSLKKNMFLSHGWQRCLNGTKLDCHPCENFQIKELLLQPISGADNAWFTVDGEPFEALPAILAGGVSRELVCDSLISEEAVILGLVAESLNFEFVLEKLI